MTLGKAQRQKEQAIENEWDEKRSSETWIEVLNVNRNWISRRKYTIFCVPSRIIGFLVPEMKMSVCLYVYVLARARAFECATFHHWKVDKPVVHHNWRQMPLKVWIFSSYYVVYQATIMIATRFIPMIESQSLSFVLFIGWNKTVLSFDQRKLI